MAVPAGAVRSVAADRMPVEPPVVSPASLAEAFAVMAQAPARPIAGGTDLMVALTGELGDPPERVVDLWKLDDLRGIVLDGDAVSMGPLTTYTQLRRSAICREHLPALVEAAATIGAAQIQNRGTIGGNVANASPAGDTLPVLLALDASFLCGSVRGERAVAASDFWPAYRTTELQPDELLVRIRIPLAAGRETRFRKIGTRRAQSISKVVIALGYRDSGRAKPWRDVRLALGSVAPTPMRARATELSLEGRPPTPETADRAAETLAAELHPIDDVRSTAEYRRLVAARVLHRLIREAGGW
ncbi:MAG: xanthine dehydrogenase small subunit [Chloroflexota bacterium]|nr:xanthine dehydrogenase small subunit [Chloroflexota bacterium]